MKLFVIFVHFLFSVTVSATSNVQFYTGTINNALLSGNSIFDDIYMQFNSTGILVVGAILLATSGLVALHNVVDPYKVKELFHDIREGPLGFIPKPKLLYKNRPLAYNKIDQNQQSDFDDNDENNIFLAKPTSLTKTKTFSYDYLDAPDPPKQQTTFKKKPPVTFSYDIHGYDAASNRAPPWTPDPTTTPTPTSAPPIATTTTFKTYDATFSPLNVKNEIEDSFVSNKPGPPYENRRNFKQKRPPQKIYMDMRGSSDNAVMERLRNAISRLDSTNQEQFKFEDYYDDQDDQMLSQASNRRYHINNDNRDKNVQFIPKIRRGFKTKAYLHKPHIMYKYYKRK